MRKQAEDGTPEGGAHLDDKLHLIIGGVTGCDEGGVESPAEGGQGVHGLLVVESEDGVHPAGELRTNCGDRRGQKDVERVFSIKASTHLQTSASSPSLEETLRVTFLTFICPKI